jgi:hypothetical protein
MKINNKYSMGSKVFYPSADLSNPSIIKSTVIGVSYYKDGEEELISYRTEHSYGVREEHLSKGSGGAKKTLIKLMEDKKGEFLTKFDEAIKLTKEMSPKNLLNRLPNETADPDGEI